MTRPTGRCTTRLWGEARAGGGGACSPASGHSTLPAPSPTRNQPEAARVLLHAGCRADALNGTQSTALHVAVQRGFLEVVRVLCECGCDVNVPVSAGAPGSVPGLKETVTVTYHLVTPGPPLTGCPCQHTAALCHLSGRRCQWHCGGPHRSARHRRHGHQQPRLHPAAPRFPQGPRAVSLGRAHSWRPGSCRRRATPGMPRAQPRPPAPTELSGGSWLGRGSWWMPRRRTASRPCTWLLSTTTGRWRRLSSERCGHGTPAGQGRAVRARQGPRAEPVPPPPRAAAT